MRGKGQSVIGIGGRESVLTEEERPGIIEHLDGLIGQLSVEERSEPRRVVDAEERTLGWYDRLHRAYRGGPLSKVQAEELREYLDEVAPHAVARWNARQLSDELLALEREAEGAGMGPSERAAVRSSARTLREDLDRSGRYRPEHDRALEMVMAAVRRAPAAWAEPRLRRLEAYTSRHRWWL